jgi:hypothetical protein
MVLGVMGNLATCLVILNNEYMRTPTNVYLLNLAIADIATLVISKINCFASFSKRFYQFFISYKGSRAFKSCIPINTVTMNVM